MTRLAMDGVDLFVVEHGCAANVKVIRVVTAIYELQRRQLEAVCKITPPSTFTPHRRVSFA